MNRRIKTPIVLISLFCGTGLISPIALGQNQTITKFEQHQIHQAPDTTFSGKAHFSRYPILPTSNDVAPAIVHFEANTVTNWHIHKHGQYLIVTDGEGRTQEWGQPIQHLSVGDIVWCPPGTKHWHGASVDKSMTHIAISPVSTDGPSVTWLEKVEFN
ncbi:cupin domain-containing protein [Vibrio diazotrophicus]|uniref:cupin domain-containing protein n=1 Tax=Vibrio diazotrophicus TaxID=685 RepID=UPI0006941863|nr:cupin domain-containing protein [Vibrio diazotrophicus]